MMRKTVSLIVFYTPDGRILLQDRRSMNKGSDWGYFGGKIELGETPEQALVRETKEELAYTLVKYTYLGHFEIYDSPEKHVDGYVYVASLPVNYDSLFIQSEGVGMTLWTIPQARKLPMLPGDDLVLDALEKFFSS
jgi:8-oxo-dGTP diphosphatase